MRAERMSTALSARKPVRAVDAPTGIRKLPSAFRDPLDLPRKAVPSARRKTALRLPSAGCRLEKLEGFAEAAVPGVDDKVEGSADALAGAMVVEFAARAAAGRRLAPVRDGPAGGAARGQPVDAAEEPNLRTLAVADCHLEALPGGVASVSGRRGAVAWRTDGRQNRQFKVSAAAPIAASEHADRKRSRRRIADRSRKPIRQFGTGKRNIQRFYLERKGQNR